MIKLFFGLSILALTSTAGVALAFLMVGPERLAEQALPQVKEEVDPRDAVVTELQKVGELTTAVQRTQQIVPVTRTRELWGKELGKASLTYIAAGQVRAGIDLSKVRKGGPGVIILPAIEILDVEIDVEESQIAGQGQTGLAPAVTAEMTEMAQQEAHRLLTEAAPCDDGLQELALASAVEQMTAIVSLAGLSEEDIQVVPTEVESCE